MFVVLAVVNALLTLGIWLAIPETLPEERRHAGGLRQTGRSFRGLVRDRAFLGYALTVAFADSNAPSNALNVNESRLNEVLL